MNIATFASLLALVTLRRAGYPQAMTIDTLTWLMAG
jgi:hypothetical protein